MERPIMNSTPVTFHSFPRPPRRYHRDPPRACRPRRARDHLVLAFWTGHGLLGSERGGHAGRPPARHIMTLGQKVVEIEAKPTIEALGQFLGVAPKAEPLVLDEQLKHAIGRYTLVFHFHGLRRSSEQHAAEGSPRLVIRILRMARFLAIVANQGEIRMILQEKQVRTSGQPAGPIPVFPPTRRWFQPIHIVPRAWPGVATKASRRWASALRSSERSTFSSAGAAVTASIRLRTSKPASKARSQSSPRSRPRLPLLHHSASQSASKS